MELFLREIANAVLPCPDVYKRQDICSYKRIYLFIWNNNITNSVQRKTHANSNCIRKILHYVGQKYRRSQGKAISDGGNTYWRKSCTVKRNDNVRKMTIKAEVGVIDG